MDITSIVAVATVDPHRTAKTVLGYFLYLPLLGFAFVILLTLFSISSRKYVRRGWMFLSVICCVLPLFGIITHLATPMRAGFFRGVFVEMGLLLASLFFLVKCTKGINHDDAT